MPGPPPMPPPMPTIDMPMPPPPTPPLPTPLPHSCPEVMCMMYCENGMVQDENGCDTCQCNDPVVAIDPPIRSIDPLPVPLSAST